MPQHQLPPIPQPPDITVLMRMMSCTTSSTITLLRPPTLLDNQPEPRFFIRMLAKKPPLRSSLSLRPRWKPTWPNSSQEPGLSLTLTTLERSTLPNPTLSCDPFLEDSTNSSSPQDPSPTSPSEDFKAGWLERELPKQSFYQLDTTFHTPNATVPS